MITLKTLPEATAQEVFDQVARHLILQKIPSKLGNYCRYKNGGLKCAAGCLISDEEYHEGLEKTSWRSLVKLGKVPGAHEWLIADLQDVHDYDYYAIWKQRLAKIAHKYELNTDVLN